MKFSLRNPAVADQDQQRNNEGLVTDLNQIAQFVYTGTGVPTLTPPSRAVYIRQDGGAATTLYVWEGAAWAAK